MYKNERRGGQENGSKEKEKWGKQEDHRPVRGRVVWRSSHNHLMAEAGLQSKSSVC